MQRPFVHRMACVDLPAFPLQLLLRRHAEWRGLPVAVVDRDSPQGRLLWVNDRARSSRILPGLRYAAALSLCGELRAGEVSGHEITDARTITAERLRRFTPIVEAAAEQPGVFWLGTTGLGRLYDSPVKWARDIRDALKQKESLESAVVLGFTRFGTFAIARASRGVVVLEDGDQEHATARRVPLDRLELVPATRGALAKLGVHTAGEFADLPPEGIEKRFGPGAAYLHREARGEFSLPLESQTPETPPSCTVHLDDAERDLYRLMALVRRELAPLLEELEERGRAASELQLEMRLDRGGEQRESLRPATPTNDLEQLVELVRLRLESLHLQSQGLRDGVTDFTLTVPGARLTSAQLELFTEAPARDLAAASRALARIRAQCGEDSVVIARVRDGHLPEALFLWEPVSEVRVPAPCHVECGALVRRIFARPLMLPARPRHEPDGWMLRGLDQGRVVRVLGPYIVSGGWWRRRVHREYHFAETDKGEILWLYYDRFRRRWFIHGRVE